MRKSTRLAAAIAAAVVFAAPVCSACTSFAVYSERTLYGMNFDYDTSVPVRLLVDESGETVAFHLAFVMGPRSVPRTAGMNEHGLFVTTQELHPMMLDVGTPGPGEQCFWVLYARALSQLASVADVEERLAANRMVNCPGVTLHAMFADPSGRAIVVEPGEDGHRVTEVDNDRIVMTNFANCRFVGSDPDSVRGFGADRYRIAHDHLEEHFEGFDVADGLGLLEGAASQWTRCSMVFDPAAGAVYVTLEGDFSKVLRVSLADRAIETYSGYDQHESWHLNKWGVSAISLQGGTPGFFERIRDFFGQ
jgi:hypothetical protein